MVELVHLYSNPKAELETLPKLLVRATSTPRPHERSVSRQTQVRLDPHQATVIAAAYRDGQTMKELAQRYGVHRTTVSALLRRLNVELRSRRYRDVASPGVAR
jgi:DNA-binding MarR family transcriptional regulator